MKTHLSVRDWRSLLLTLPLLISIPLGAQSLPQYEQLARDIHKELVEINTVTATGDTLAAAEAMAARLRAAGFPEGDVQVLSPAPRKGNLVARLRGSGARRPILLLAHLDVVEARPEHWSTDPFKLIERDGYLYGRGVSDDKFMGAVFIANLIRYRQEDFHPDRDIIVALETDEETLDAEGRGIQWLLKNHRELIDAEFALNEGGNVGLKDGKAIRNAVQMSEKASFSYRLEVNNKGGHSSLPSRDNAIYHLAEGLSRLAHFDFPVHLNPTTRTFFERSAEMEPAQMAADMRAVLAEPPDPAAVARLSAIPAYNAQLRTTCVATLLEGGHAYNALPQSARATVNCRILPGEPVSAVSDTLRQVLDDEQIALTPIGSFNPSPPSPVHAELMQAISDTTAQLWPGIPVIPIMSASATDAAFLRNAGIPTYGHSGLAADLFDVRIHGKDERILVQSFRDGQEYLYRLVKTLASGH